MHATNIQYPVPNNHSGVSLVELLIVVTLTVILIVSATSLLFTTLLSGGKVNSQKTVKENGDYSMGQMTTLLRNAVVLLPNTDGDTCELGMDEIRFRSFDEGVTTFSGVSTGSVIKIASNSGVYLTSDAVTVETGPTFNCYQSPDRAITTIDISFTLETGDSNDRSTDYHTEDFMNSVTIRSF